MSKFRVCGLLFFVVACCGTAACAPEVGWTFIRPDVVASSSPFEFTVAAGRGDAFSVDQGVKGCSTAGGPITATLLSSDGPWSQTWVSGYLTDGLGGEVSVGELFEVPGVSSGNRPFPPNGIGTSITSLESLDPGQCFRVTFSRYTHCTQWGDPIYGGTTPACLRYEIDGFTFRLEF